MQYGRNELRTRGGRRWPRELVRQLVHPLALLLWLAAALLFIVGSFVVAVAVVLIIMLNAAFVGLVLGQRLDLSQPLLEMWLVEGLEEERWAIISKVHHCVVDGVGGGDLMTRLFDLSARTEPAGKPHGTILLPKAEPEPSRPALVLAGMVGTTAE